MTLNRPWIVILALFAVLAAFALYRSEVAYQHRNLMEAFLMLVIAAVLVKRVQQRS